MCVRVCISLTLMACTLVSVTAAGILSAHLRCVTPRSSTSPLVVIVVQIASGLSQRQTHERRACAASSRPLAGKARSTDAFCFVWSEKEKEAIWFHYSPTAPAPPLLSIWKQKSRSMLRKIPFHDQRRLLRGRWESEKRVYLPISKLKKRFHFYFSLFSKVHAATRL